MHRDDESEDRVPSSPANPDSLAARVGRNARGAALRLHIQRMLMISAGVLIVGAGASLYLAEVGTKSCWQDSHGAERCVTTEWYALTLQRRSSVETYNGVPHGTRTDWYASGEVWLTGRYQHGRRVGEWQERWPTGDLRFSGTYVADALHGTESWWYASGQMEWQVHRKNGERHGQEIWWHPNGNRRRVGNYEQGERHGVFSLYSLDGSPTFSVEYARGERLARASGDERFAREL